MEIKYFDAIMDFCDNNQKTLTECEKDFIIRKTLRSVYEAITFREKELMRKLNTDEIEAIYDAMVGSETLKSHAEAASTYYLKVQDTLTSDYRRMDNRKKFMRDLGISILGAVVYSLLLIFIFWLAKDQISNWLLQLSQMPSTPISTVPPVL